MKRKERGGAQQRRDDNWSRSSTESLRNINFAKTFQASPSLSFHPFRRKFWASSQWRRGPKLLAVKWKHKGCICSLNHALENGLTHEASGIGAVSANLAINLDKTLHENVLNFLSIQGILEAVAQEDDKRKAFTSLVGTSARLGSVGA